MYCVLKSNEQRTRANKPRGWGARSWSPWRSADRAGWQWVSKSGVWLRLRVCFTLPPMTHHTAHHQHHIKGSLISTLIRSIVYSAYTNALSLFKAPNSAFSLMKARAYDTLRMNYLPVYLTYFDLTPTGAKRRCHKNIMYSFIAVSISKLRNSLIILTCAVHL